jgi:hypothetical protein
MHLDSAPITREVINVCCRFLVSGYPPTPLYPPMMEFELLDEATTHARVLCYFPPCQL